MIVVVLTVVVCDAVVVTGMASGSEGGGAVCRVGTGGETTGRGLEEKKVVWLLRTLRLLGRAKCFLLTGLWLLELLGCAET